MSRLLRPRKILGKTHQGPSRVLSKSGRLPKGSLHELVNSVAKPRILIVRSLGGIGDVLMTLPGVKALKAQYPHAHITYACDRISTGTEDVYFNLLRGCPFIDAVVEATTVDKSKFTAWVDVTRCCVRYEHKRLPAKNRIDIFAEEMKVKLTDPLPWYAVLPQEGHAASIYLSSVAPGKKIIFLHTASFDSKRTWPVENYLGLVRAAKDLPIHFLVSDYNSTYGGWANEPNCTLIPGEFSSVRLKAALIQGADFFIGPDSGLMHLAGALKKPSLVIFGPIPPVARINHYPTHHAVSLKLPCQYCWYNHCPYQVKCLVDLSPLMVLDRTKQLLEIK